MSKTDHVYLMHIQKSIDQILDYSANVTEPEFYESQLIKDAVVRNFEIIGEAAKNISNKTKSKYPNIAWKNMAGMRDKLIHDYIAVDYAIVWTTIQEILPDLKGKIEFILKENYFDP